MSLGKLSAKYESNGNPWTVSTGAGDAGGVSYGTYQLSSVMGSAQSFVNWLLGKGHHAGSILNKNTPGTREFSSAWKFCAENFSDFGELQREYIEWAYYQPAVAALKRAHYNIENHHEVMKDVVWSRAVQYGVGNIVEMFEEACKMRLGYPNLSYVDAPEFDEAMIKGIYLDVCKTPEWTGGSPSLRVGLYERFESECWEAVGRVGENKIRRSTSIGYPVLCIFCF